MEDQSYMMSNTTNKSTKEYSTYLRLLAERYVKGMGYDIRKLGRARQRDGVTVYPISGSGLAVAIDSQGKPCLTML